MAQFLLRDGDQQDREILVALQGGLGALGSEWRTADRLCPEIAVGIV